MLTYNGCVLVILNLCLISFKKIWICISNMTNADTAHINKNSQLPSAILRV